MEVKKRTKLEEKRREPVFPKMTIATEGAFLSPQGKYVHTVYVDLSGELNADRLRLVKATTTTEGWKRGCFQVAPPGQVG